MVQSITARATITIPAYVPTLSFTTYPQLSKHIMASFAEIDVLEYCQLCYQSYAFRVTRGSLLRPEFRLVHLVATHITTNETKRFELADGRFPLGRASGQDPPGKIVISFDPKLSRRTAVLEISGDIVWVERDGSRFPLFHEGIEKEKFQLVAGQRFSSAETVFELISQTAQTLTVGDMQATNRRNAEQILQVLLGTQELLVEWCEPALLASRAVELLRDLVPGAEVAFFALESAGDPQPLAPSSLRPSRSLVAECLRQGLPAYHLWVPSSGEGQPTQMGGESWALAAPVVSSQECLVLYAVGHDSENTPGELERGALALVARTLSRHLEAGHSAMLAAKVEAEQTANRKLRILLSGIERSLSLQGDGVESAFLEAARDLVDGGEVGFHRDLSELLGEEKLRLGEDEDGTFLALAFEHYHPKGLLCRKLRNQEFRADDEEWLSALLGFAETVFENRRLHQEVQRSLQQLKESQSQLIRSSQWAAAGRLAANAAHELNTPLGAIRLAAETAQSFLKDGPAPTIDGLKLIQRSVERCKKVTERLLVYSKPREEKEIEEFSLEEIIQDSLSSLGPLLRLRPVEIQWEPVDYRAVGDVQDCYWAVTNVLKNAFDALTEQAERTVRLTTWEEAETTHLLVEDSGSGVPVEILARLFEPFTSSKKIGEGNGLGLAISRRNLRSWGGDMEPVASSLGGAAFRLTFPRHSKSG